MSYLSATSSCDKAVLPSDPAFFRNIVVLRDPKLNPVNRRNREHCRKRIPQEYVIKDNKKSRLF